MNVFKLTLFSSAFLFTVIPLANACDPTPNASDISSTPSALSLTVPSSIAEEDDIEWDKIQLPNFLEKIELEEAKTDYTKIYNLVGTSLGRYLINTSITHKEVIKGLKRLSLRENFKDIYEY